MHDIDILKEIDNSLNKIDNSTAPYLTLEALEELEEK
jgi:hypothetical protein